MIIEKDWLASGPRRDFPRGIMIGRLLINMVRFSYDMQ